MSQKELKDFLITLIDCFSTGDMTFSSLPSNNSFKKNIQRSVEVNLFRSLSRSVITSSFSSYEHFCYCLAAILAFEYMVCHKETGAYCQLSRYMQPLLIKESAKRIVTAAIKIKKLDAAGEFIRMYQEAGTAEDVKQVIMAIPTRKVALRAKKQQSPARADPYQTPEIREEPVYNQELLYMMDTDTYDQENFEVFELDMIDQLYYDQHVNDAPADDGVSTTDCLSPAAVKIDDVQLQQSQNAAKAEETQQSQNMPKKDKPIEFKVSKYLQLFQQNTEDIFNEHREQQRQKNAVLHSIINQVNNVNPMEIKAVRKQTQIKKPK